MLYFEPTKCALGGRSNNNDHKSAQFRKRRPINFLGNHLFVNLKFILGASIATIGSAHYIVYLHLLLSLLLLVTFSSSSPRCMFFFLFFLLKLGLQMRAREFLLLLDCLLALKILRSWFKLEKRQPLVVEWR